MAQPSHTNDYFEIALKHSERMDNKDDFLTSMLLAFNEAKEISPENGINQLFLIFYRQKNCDLNVLKIAIDMGVNPNDQVLLTFAVVKQDIATITFLLNQYQMKIDLKLMKICVNYPKIVEVLIECDFDYMEMIIEIIASSSPSNELLEMIVNRIITTNFTNLKCLTLLLKFVNRPVIDIDRLKKLIELGANVSDPNYNFVSIACEDSKNGFEKIKYFINEYGYRPTDNILSIAIDKNNLDLVKFLLDVGVPITGQAIESAVKKDISMVKLLVSFGVTIQELTRAYYQLMTHQSTAIFIVENGGNLNDVELILESTPSLIEVDF